MSVPFKDVPGGPPVPDVDALMRGVRAAVAAKFDRGVYTPAELEELRRIEEDLCGRTERGPGPAEDIALLRSSWDPLGPHTFTSHRAVIGGLVVAAKRWLRRFARPVAAVALARQAEFNGVAARLLAGAAEGVHSLEAGNAALVRRVATLERGNQELLARCDELQAEVRALQARLDREGSAGKPP